MAAKRRRRVEHTDDWKQLELLLDWPEQVEYEKIRDVVVFGDPVILCAKKTATPERTLHRRVESFEAYGMEGLIPLEPARGRRISLTMRNRIVELKAEYPPFSLGEIARICYALFGKAIPGLAGVIQDMCLDNTDKGRKRSQRSRPSCAKQQPAHARL